MYESDEYTTMLINSIQLIFEQCIFLDIYTGFFFLFLFIIIIFIFWCALKFSFDFLPRIGPIFWNLTSLDMLGALCWCLIPILVDLCPHLVASTAAVHENLSGGLQTSKYYIYIDFENRPVYDASLLSLWKYTMVCWMKNKACWIKKSWKSPEK